LALFFGRLELSSSNDVLLTNLAALAVGVGRVTMTEPSGPKDRRKPSEPNVEEARLRQQAIGVKLRQMFDDVVNEPVPDDFLDILRQADSRSSPTGPSGDRD
jgi:hypothetical protein